MGKKRRFPVGILLLAAAVIVIAGIWIKNSFFGEEKKNLARMKGVKATCDSSETDELSADKAIDGDDETLSSRWSSENNWENASHYIKLEFPEEISVSFVVLKWERTNVISYLLEGSPDGENWDVLADFRQAPETKRQEIPLEEAVTVRFLRLSTREVSQTEEDYSNLYQNVSLYEFEVYADKPAAYLLEKPVIEATNNNMRYLKMPEAPEGYRVTYLGADYEQVIGADGTVYGTIQEKEVNVGFLVERTDGTEEAKEVSFTVTVPAMADDLQGGNEAPEVIPAIAEWDGGDGAFIPGRESRIIVQDAAQDSAGGSGRDFLWQSAELFARQYRMIMGYEIPVIEGGAEDVRAGDFYLAYAKDTAGGTEDDIEEIVDVLGAIVDGVGEEGYVCDITDRCVITGTHRQGIYWGTITVLQILQAQDGAAQSAGSGKERGTEPEVRMQQDTVRTIPQGRIRDYPKYPVRGFGIDVARKAVSMDMLYQIMTNMSWYKMNDLSIHLNDNVILSTSGLTSSVEEAMTADSAFRLEIDIANEKGERLTSEEYAYTAEELAQFIETAETYGVRVVPEIDTPAHSLAITKLYPEYALTVRNEAVDQIDLSRKEAVALVKDIWCKSIESGAFASAVVVNVGMDEYYGDGETYRNYMNDIIALVKEKSGIETVRLWGSLSNIEGTAMPDTQGLQMNIWSTLWADPLAMYQAGYSLINMQNNHLYIIPGGGYDYLDTEEIFQNWEPNKFYDYNQLERIPDYSPKMLGAAYMIWNDMCGSLDVGISESDIFVRFFEPLGIISGKLWGETSGSCQEWTVLFNKLGKMPESNPYDEPLWQEESLRLTAEEVISLSGGADYVETGYSGDSDVRIMENGADGGSRTGNIDVCVGSGNGVGIGGSYEISMQLFRENSGALSADDANRGTVQEEILFETDSAYGQTAFKAVQTGTGQVGFSREGRDYSFDYTLPAGEWVTLTIRGEQNRTSLYVDGKLVDTLGDGEPFTEYATFVFPLERIGSKTHSFHGMIKEVIVSVGTGG